MKKLLVVVSVLFVVALFAGPLFAASMYDPEQRNAKLAEVKASPLKVSGEFTFGMATPFDSDYAGIGYANAYVDFTWYPDEYNSLLLELAFSKEYSTNAGIGGVGASWPYFELTTDVGKALDLPVGLFNTIGLTSLYTNKYEVTGHAWERTKIRSDIDPVAWKIKVDASMVQITAGIGFGERTNDPTAAWQNIWTDDNGDAIVDITDGDGIVNEPVGTNDKGEFNDFGIYAFIPELGPAAVELWYLAQDNADFKGDLGFSVKTIPLFNDLVSFAGGFRYNMVDGSVALLAASYAYKKGLGEAITDEEKLWAWGAGAKFNIIGAGIGVSVNGDVVDAFDQLAVDVNYQFADSPFGVDLDAAFTFADTIGSTFLGAELSAFVKVGGAKWNIGYLIDGDNEDGFGYAYSVAKVNPQSKGGFFIVGDINF